MKKTGILLLLLGILAPTIRAQARETVEVPEEVVAISEELGGEYGICPELIQAVCWQESRFQADAENGGCVGIMQVSPQWHRERMERLGVTDLTDPRQNMAVAVDYLAELAAEYEDVGAALMKYNGDRRLDELLEGGMADVSDYARAVLELSAELERRNGK